MIQKLYLDTEFNGFQGDLISIGLAPASQSLPTFYAVVEGSWQTTPHAWVSEHVIPHLDGAVVMSREQAARQLAEYLRSFAANAPPVIVADWPTDFSQLLDLFIIGPGRMVGLVDFTMEYKALRGFATAEHSRIPHHALFDAIALRDHCVSIRA